MSMEYSTYCKGFILIREVNYLYDYFLGLLRSINLKLECRIGFLLSSKFSR